MRTIVIGDVHGDHLGLKALIGKVDPAPLDTIVLAGDICDHFTNPDRNVRMTVDYILEISESRRVVTVRGNHDWWFADFMLTGSKQPIWTDQGGKQTLEDYDLNPIAAMPSEIPAAHRSYFIDGMVPWHEDERCVVVHAGMTPAVMKAIWAGVMPGFHDDLMQEAIWAYGNDRPMDMTLPEEWMEQDGRHVVIGHTARLFIDGRFVSGPFLYDKLCCIDSWRGLHACVIHHDGTREIVASSLVTPAK